MIFEIYSSLFGLIRTDLSDWKNKPEVVGQGTLWFHAASAGELEIIIPIISESVRKGRKTCVSIFSTSAESSLKKLPAELLYCGYSPLESEWEDCLGHFGVSEVITSKYEAWPGLWRAASLKKIRLTVVSAQMRSSLLWAKRLLKVMGVALPRLRFYVLDEQSIPGLKLQFPDSECVFSADPRWLRVIQRAENVESHVAFQKWRARHSHAPLPYWVIGSAWTEDMEILSPAIENYPGTVWVVPHDLKNTPDPEIYAPHANCILVNEMGLLVELYSIATRAWVGGGFGKGIHSTLEPAVYSIPVACGPNKVEDFFEAKELMRQNALAICDTPDKVQKWLDTPSQPSGFSLKLKIEMIHQMIGSIVQ